MAKTSAERKSGPHRTTRCAALTVGSTLVGSASASAQSFSSLPPGLDAMLGNVIWWAVTGGTALAAFAAFGLLLRASRDDRLATAQREIVTLRAARDRAEALIGADDQRTIIWDTAVGEPQIFGGLPEAVAAPSNEAAFLTFSKWLEAESATSIEAAIDKLRREGEPFQIAARAGNGALLEVSGRTSGRRALVRFRELTGERRSFAELKEQAVYVINEMSALRALADLLPIPLWRRNRTGRLTWVNAAYVRAVEAESQDGVLSSGIELLPLRTREAIREAAREGKLFEASASAVMAGDRQAAESLGEADRGRQRRRRARRIRGGCRQAEACPGDRTRTRKRSTGWLQASPSSGATATCSSTTPPSARSGGFRPTGSRPRRRRARSSTGSAPNENCPSSRIIATGASKHLAAYLSAAPREDVWHLPDGRTLRVVAVPNSDGGMSYIYENVTEQISLESRLAALSTLQGETLDHLFEAVAVFGTDGRLRLFNPVFANMWRLSPTTLRAEPHIGEIISTCQAIYSEKSAWDGIRTAVTDFDHADQAAGRMARPDGSVIDFATVALPEGMTMLTFVDVTDSASIERVLKERNEALEAADRLKSDFIQHVSYELRTPLTNIIGQAEILANEMFGKLNPKQRDYMGDILNSSEALRALINDILDLATVDAGIMSLDIQETGIIAAVASSIEGLRDRLSEQKIALDFDVPEDIGTFHVDPQRVRQILFNLLSNAIRFSNAGGHIHVAAAKSANVDHLHRGRRRHRDSAGALADSLRTLRGARVTGAARRGRARALDREEPGRAPRWRGRNTLRGRQGDDGDRAPADHAGRHVRRRRIMPENAEAGTSLLLPDERATERLAEDVAAVLKTGDIVALFGGLGAGKTTFARALIRALAADPSLEVQSPTFPLRIDHSLPRINVTHADLYRIGAERELDELGLDEAITDGALVVEWPERLAPDISRRAPRDCAGDCRSRPPGGHHGDRNLAGAARTNRCDPCVSRQRRMARCEAHAACGRCIIPGVRNVCDGRAPSPPAGERRRGGKDAAAAFICPPSLPSPAGGG